MVRRVQPCQKPCERCCKCRRQLGRTRIPTPQLVRDVIEYLSARQAALKNQNQSNTRPIFIANKGGGSAPTGDANPGGASPQNAKTPPTVPLPHGLGTITVPQGAQRLDVRFNCVTNKLPSGQLADNLVVNVDVIYNFGCGPNGTKIASQAPVKSET